MSRKHSSILVAASLIPAAVLLVGSRVEAVSSTGLARGLGHQVPFVTLDQGPCGPWLAASVQLFSSEEEWDAVMADLADRNLVDMAPVSAPAGIDWSRQSLVLVTMGELAANGYTVEVRGIDRSGVTGIVEVDFSAPARRGWGRGFCRPYQLVAIEKHGMKQVQGRFRWVDAGGTTAVVSLEGLSRRLSPNAGPGPVRTLSWGALKSLEY